MVRYLSASVEHIYLIIPGRLKTPMFNGEISRLGYGCNVRSCCMIAPASNNGHEVAKRENQNDHDFRRSRHVPAGGGYYGKDKSNYGLLFLVMQLFNHEPFLIIGCFFLFSIPVCHTLLAYWFVNGYCWCS